MNPTYRPEEIAKQLETSGAKLVQLMITFITITILRYVLTIGLFLQNIKQAADIYGGVGIVE